MKPLLIVFLFCATAFTALAQNKQNVSGKPETKSAFPKASQYSHTSLTYKIIPSLNSTWGYDIYADGRLMIHQPSVPGMPGNDGFKDKVGAMKVAGLVIEKIKMGEMPPTIEVAEIKKLKAI